MEELLRACDAASEYPRNLIHYNNYNHDPDVYTNRLDDQESDLFVEETKACLDLWETKQF